MYIGSDVVLGLNCVCSILLTGAPDMSSGGDSGEPEMGSAACGGVGERVPRSRGVMGVLEGAVVRVSAFPPYSRAVVAVVVRVLPIEVDVVVLHLSGGSFWRRLPRGHVVQYICDYWGEVPLPLSEGGLLWEFDEEHDVDVSRGGVSAWGPVGVGGVSGGRGDVQHRSGQLVSSHVRVDGESFRASCYRNMVRLLSRSRELGSEVRDRMRVDDMHCVGRLLVLAARRAGRTRLDEVLRQTLETMFEMEEIVGMNYRGVGESVSREGGEE